MNDSKTITKFTNWDIYMFCFKTVGFKYGFPFFAAMDYKALLKKAREGMPDLVHEKQRFEVPKVKGHIQGNRTIVTNFIQIAQLLHRDVDHMLKFVLRELAAPGELKKSGSLIFGTKIPASRINEKIKKYVHEFVLCPECGKPDTQLLKEGGFVNIKCLACGEKHPVKSKI